VEIPLALPRFSEAGAAWFSPSGDVLVLSGWDGSFFGPSPIPDPVGIRTYLVDAKGTITPFGPADTQPALSNAQSGVPGGRRLLRRQRSAVGGDLGLFILDADGQGPFISDPGRPIGVLS
jgi:hypothetical protein